MSKVALLAEGVDRNIVFVYYHTRALVALLAEGVDRNAFLSSSTPPTALSRPPRGGRG